MDAAPLSKGPRCALAPGVHGRTYLLGDEGLPRRQDQAARSALPGSRVRTSPRRAAPYPPVYTQCIRLTTISHNSYKRRRAGERRRSLGDPGPHAAATTARRAGPTKAQWAEQRPGPPAPWWACADAGTPRRLRAPASAETVSIGRAVVRVGDGGAGLRPAQPGEGRTSMSEGSADWPGYSPSRHGGTRAGCGSATGSTGRSWPSASTANQR
jgi:hypothetical protein